MIIEWDLTIMDRMLLFFFNRPFNRGDLIDKWSLIEGYVVIEYFIWIVEKSCTSW